MASEKNKQLQNIVQTIYITPNTALVAAEQNPKPNFQKTKQPFSSPGGGGIQMRLFQSVNLDPRKLV